MPLYSLSMDALTLLERKTPPAPQPVYALTGDEHFLKRLVQTKLEEWLLGTGAGEFGRTVCTGDAAEWAAVHDELTTLPFASPRRLVVVQDADPFVTRYRDKLEKYLGHPSSTGTLLLVVKSWVRTTRLAKALPEAATIECNAPKQLAAWCSKWASNRYGKALNSAAANVLVELAGSDMGVLDQEIAKLSAYVGNAPQIQAKDVDQLVGHSRLLTAWQMLDAAAEGNSAKALTTLHHLFEQGEEPIAILGAISWQLRRLAQVARLCQQGSSLQAAMSKAGLPPFKTEKVQQQLRLLGPRSLQLYDWLLEADLALKSTASLPPRAVIERLLVKLAGGSASR
jgi:DNA polymerase III subunit delta